MNQWHIDRNGVRSGPYTDSELFSHASQGTILPTDMIWTQELSQWIPAESLDGISWPSRPTHIYKHGSVRRIASPNRFSISNLFPESRDYDLFSKRFSTFWFILFLGVTPLLICTVQHLWAQRILFSLFFALTWGALLKVNILKNNDPWKWPILSLLFTGFLVNFLLQLIHTSIPPFMSDLPASDNLLFSLLGHVFIVGIKEEFLKAIPVLIAFLFNFGGKRLDFLVVLGVFSGLGFAATENLSYENLMASHSLQAFAEGTMDDFAVSMHMQVTNSMLRSISLVFLHASFSGSVAAIMSLGLLYRYNPYRSAFIGILVVGVLHGFYNWFSMLQPTFSAFIAAFSFFLFYSLYQRLLRQSPSNVRSTL